MCKYSLVFGILIAPSIHVSFSMQKTFHLNLLIFHYLVFNVKTCNISDYAPVMLVTLMN